MISPKWRPRLRAWATGTVTRAIHPPWIGFRDRRYFEEKLRDFVVIDGNRRSALVALLRAMREVRLLFTLGKRASFAKAILDACARIDDGHLRLANAKLRSYVDVSVQMRVLRIFCERLAADPTALTAQILEHFPTSRAALLAHAEILLDRGDSSTAIEFIERALRVQAVCMTAQRLLFRAKAPDYELRDKFCQMPFTHFSTGWKGAAFACCCPAWVPFPIGNVLEAESAEAVWNSDAAIEVRRSILDGDFSYCSRTLCSLITARKLPAKSEITEPYLRRIIDERITALPDGPRQVDLNYDATCNLACPSCRTEIIAATPEENDVYGRARDRVILPLLKKTSGQVYLSGGGEAFSSRHYRSILAALNRQDYPGVYLHLISNGQLITPKKWSEFPDLAEMIHVLSVSIDAARPETYERLRRPGKWAPLMRNLEFLSELRRNGKIRNFWINFVVQKSNFREMLDFVDLGGRLGVDKVWFQRVTNYGAFDQATIANLDVASPAHPDHAELQEILRHPRMHGRGINRQMLISSLPEVVASDDRSDFLP